MNDAKKQFNNNLRIALNLVELPNICNNCAMRTYEVVKLVEKKGGKADVKDIAKIMTKYPKCDKK